MDEQQPVARARAAVYAVLASAAAFLLPTLGVGLDEASVLGALLVVALTALLGAAHGSVALLARTTPAGVATSRRVPIVLATRATDPTHHPLRPRAPGTV